MHEVGIGWFYRGRAYASEISEVRLNLFREHLRAAEASVQRALELRPKLVAAYAELVEIRGATKGNSAFEAGLRLCPQCVMIRLRYSHRLAPEWGGSYEKMSEFIRSAEPWMNENPRLRALAGMVDEHKATRLAVAGRDLEAAALAKSSLRNGGYVSMFDTLADSLYRLGAHDEAIAQYSAGLKLYPQSTELLTGRSRAYAHKQEYLAAAKDLLLARQVDVMNDDAYVEWLIPVLLRTALDLRTHGQIEESRAHLDRILELDPKNQEARALLSSTL